MDDYEKVLVLVVAIVHFGFGYQKVLVLVILCFSFGFHSDSQKILGVFTGFSIVLTIFKQFTVVHITPYPQFGNFFCGRSQFLVNPPIFTFKVFLLRNRAMQIIVDAPINSSLLHQEGRYVTEFCTSLVGKKTNRCFYIKKMTFSIKSQSIRICDIRVALWWPILKQEENRIWDKKQHWFLWERFSF